MSGLNFNTHSFPMNGFPPIFQEPVYQQMETPTGAENVPAPAPESAPVAPTAATAESTAPAIYTVKQFEKKCQELSQVASEVSKLQEVIPVVNKRLENVGQQLKDLGLKPIEFKGNHFEPLNINENTSFENAESILKDHGKAVKEDLTEALRVEHDSLKVKEREVYAKDNLKHILNQQQHNVHFQPKQEHFQRTTVAAQYRLPSLSTMVALYVFFNRGFFEAIATKVAIQLIGLN